MLWLSSLETGLTVGEVAGLISGSISLLLVVIPLLFAFVLVGFIREREFDAVTWSSISQILQSSWWPLLLRSDGTVTAVRWRVGIVSILLTCSTVCLIIANYLTPKPLVEVIRASSTFRNAEFVYVPDLTYYGQATMQRQGVYRRCGWNLFMDCPDSIYNDPKTRNQYINHTVVNSTIPSKTTDIFDSGTKGSTIAGPMDMQFRAYVLDTTAYADDNAVRPVGRIENLPRLILEAKYQLVEGLIVDTINGGIGIRNHTAPVGLQLGAEWMEDILWLSPDTKCTNTNLSLHFSVASNVSSPWSTDSGYLRDDGGFANIPAQVPEPRWDTDDEKWKDVNAAPDLKSRADTLAWWNNQFTAWTMDLHSSSVGVQYKDQFDNYGHMGSTGAIKITPMDGLYLDDMVYDRKEDIASNFSTYGIKCCGYYDDDPSTSSKAFIECGYLYDAASPEGSSLGQSWRPDRGSAWKQNLYTCASGVVASVKEVTFSLNGSASLENLKVKEVKDKSYADDALPLWGVEVVDDSKYLIEDVNIFWGLIDERYANTSNLKSTRAAQIYLPAANHGNTLGEIADSFASGSVFTSAWRSTYKWAAASDTAQENSIPNYSGKMDYGLTLKWRELSKSVSGVEKVLNLIWTDLVAFTLVGTKTGFEDSNAAGATKFKHANALGTRRVHRYVRTVQYLDLRYAIPAFISAAFFVVPLILSFIMLCCLPQSWSALKHYMNQTNMGRASTQLMHRNGPLRVSPTAPTRQWVKTARNIILDVPGIGYQDRIFISRKRDSQSSSEVSSLKEPRVSESSFPSRRRYFMSDYVAVARDAPMAER